jgi:ketosteroid isomerase-like protein
MNVGRRIAATFVAGAAALSAMVAMSLSARIHAETAPQSLEARVKRLEDRAEIERLLMLYGKALDDRDFAAYSQLFAEDGEWTGSTGTFKGRAQIKAAMETAFPPASAASATPASFHLLTNAIIEVDGDRATALSKWTFVRIVDLKPVIALAGSYQDTLIRENGHWKFQRRVAPAAASK